MDTSRPGARARGAERDCPRCRTTSLTPDPDDGWRRCGACDYRWHPDPEIKQPGDLAIFVGSFDAGSHRVHWTGAELRYEVFGPGLDRVEAHTVSPSCDTWAAFWGRLHELGVWDWEEEFSLPAGPTEAPLGWSLEAGHADRWRRTGGEDAFPPDGTGPEPTSAFRALCDAVRALVDGRPFGP
jgi:hypothetical protein